MPQCKHGPAKPPAHRAVCSSTKSCNRPRRLNRSPTLLIRAAMPTSSPSSTPPAPPANLKAYASPPPTSPTCFPAPPSASINSWAKLASPTGSSSTRLSTSPRHGFSCSPAFRARAFSRCPPISPSFPTKFASPPHTISSTCRHCSSASGAASKTLFPSAPLRSVPSMPRRAKPGSARMRDAPAPHLRALICGSAPLAPETQQFFLMIGIPVLQAYGLTETTAICTLDDPRLQAEPGYVGQAIRGIEMKTVDNEEIVVRGPHVFAGYWNRPEETARVLRDGWFHTGDRGEVNLCGNWRIIGRIKNLIILNSGHNIPPEPIEDKIAQHLPGAQHVVVVGNGRGYLCVLVAGSVEPQDLQSALDAVNPALPHYRQIRNFAVVRESFTPENGMLTANGKLRRDTINSRFASEINSMYDRKPS